MISSNILQFAKNSVKTKILNGIPANKKLKVINNT